jgi:hypothetical protein
MSSPWTPSLTPVGTYFNDVTGVLIDVDGAAARLRPDEMPASNAPSKRILFERFILVLQVVKQDSRVSPQPKTLLAVIAMLPPVKTATFSL